MHAKDENKSTSKAVKRKLKLSVSFGEDQIQELPADETVGEDVGETRKRKRRRKKGKRGEISTPNDPAMEAQAVREYLRLWKLDTRLWRFNKNKQVWLLKHLYQVDQVSSETFEIAAEYLEKMKGAARVRAFEEAKSLIESDNGDASQVMLHRANLLLRSLG